jgi:hypothetical protein
MQQFVDTAADPNGTVQPGVLITVRLGTLVTSPLAPIFSDAAGTAPSPNPITTDERGQYGFFYNTIGTYSMWYAGQKVKDVYLDLLVEVASKASQAQAEALADNTVWMTPARTRDSIAAYFVAAPAASKIWTGAVTPSSFRVGFDMNTPVPVSVAYSTSSDMSGAIITTPFTPAAKPGVSTTYYPCLVSVTGLAANTRYYVAPVVNGVIQTNEKCTLVTAPTLGSATSFTFTFGSCSNTWSASKPDRVYSAIAALSPAFLLHLGDMGYPNVAVNDIRVNRDTTTRIIRQNPDWLSMCLTVPVAYTFSNHDAAVDAQNYDKTYESGATNAQLVANSQTVIGEGFPLYDLPLATTLAQVFDWGRVRFIVPDPQSWRRLAGHGGAATTLGTGTSPPGSPDQVSWLLAQLTQAATDGKKLVFMCSSGTWTGQIYQSWQQVNAAEQTSIVDAIGQLGVELVLLCGDPHESGLDDGTNTAFSTNGDVRFPQFVSSPFSQTPLTGSGPYSWDGVTKMFQDLSNQFGIVTVTDSGGSELDWTLSAMGNPIDGSYVSTTLGSVTKTSIARTVGFAAATYLAPTGGAIPVTKTGFGVCSVHWAAGTGESGTLTFKPNQKKASITLAGSVDTTITLSSPTGATLAAQTTCDITYKAIDAATAAYINAAGTIPSNTIISAIDALVTGLKTDLLWTKYQFFYLLKASSQTQALLNLVNPNTYPTTLHGTVTFTGSVGMAGDAISGYGDTGFQPDATTFQDNHSFGCYVTTSTTDGGAAMGGGNYLLRPLNGGLTAARSSFGTTETLPNATGTGLFVVRRNTSGSYVMSRGTTDLGTVTRTSVAVTTANWRLFGHANDNNGAQAVFSGRQLGIAFAGSYHSAADIALLKARVDTFIAAF